MAKASELELEVVSVMAFVMAFVEILLGAYKLYKGDSQQQSHL
jgi:hypothetical protein